MIRYVYEAKSLPKDGRNGDWRVTINDNSPVIINCNDASQAIESVMKTLLPHQRYKVNKVLIEAVIR